MFDVIECPLVLGWMYVLAYMAQAKHSRIVIELYSLIVLQRGLDLKATMADGHALHTQFLLDAGKSCRVGSNFNSLTCLSKLTVKKTYMPILSHSCAHRCLFSQSREYNESERESAQNGSEQDFKGLQPLFKHRLIDVNRFASPQILDRTQYDGWFYDTASGAFNSRFANGQPVNHSSGTESLDCRRQAILHIMQISNHID